jgi:Domain of unknown function (DUF397)
VPRKLDLSDADLASATWLSAGDRDTPNRVEIALVTGGLAMRDSDHPDGPVLLFTQAEWDAFVAGVRADEFDLPPAPAGASDQASAVPSPRASHGARSGAAARPSGHSRR